MATVYVWSANVIEGSLGHASLYIHDTREYISWWPTDSKRKLALTCKKAKILQGLPKTYHEEIEEFMQRLADHTFHIKEYCIDSDKMIQKWQTIFGDEEYHLLSKNCSTVIIDVLNSGMLCTKYRPKPGLTDVFTPNDVKKYGQKLQTLTTRQEKKTWSSCLKDRLSPFTHRFKYGCNCNCLFEEGLCYDRTLCCYFKCCMLFACVCLCSEMMSLNDYLYSKVTSCCQCNRSVKHDKYEEIYDV